MSVRAARIAARNATFLSGTDRRRPGSDALEEASFCRTWWCRGAVQPADCGREACVFQDMTRSTRTGAERRPWRKSPPAGRPAHNVKELHNRGAIPETCPSGEEARRQDARPARTGRRPPAAVGSNRGEWPESSGRTIPGVRPDEAGPGVGVVAERRRLALVERRVDGLRGVSSTPEDSMSKSDRTCARRSRQFAGRCAVIASRRAWSAGTAPRDDVPPCRTSDSHQY